MYMSNYDKILNYAKENNGYITTKKVRDLEINRCCRCFSHFKIWWFEKKGLLLWSFFESHQN